MPKTKPVTKKKPARAARPPRSVPPRANKRSPRAPAAPAPKPAAPKEAYATEYLDYLERYASGGAGRPRLTPGEFDRLDEELLDLLAVESERGLNDEQIIRLQELEYLLLDSE